MSLILHTNLTHQSLTHIRSRRFPEILSFNSAATTTCCDSTSADTSNFRIPLLLIIAVLYAEAAVFNQKLYNCDHFKTVYYGDTRAFLVHDFGAIMHAVSADGSWAE